MSWLDRVLAVPLVGLRFSPQFWSAEDSLSRLRPRLRDWAAAKREVQASVLNAFQFRLDAGDGLVYLVNSDNVTVQFQYPTSMDDAPGSLPAPKFTVERAAYSELLGRVVEETADLLGDLARESLPLIRIGVVASISMSEDEWPPGVAAFVEHIARPWGGGVPAMSGRITGIINDEGGASDRCHHTFERDTDRGGGLRLTLDWQRLYAEPLQLDPASARKSIEEGTLNALRYFERFAEGDLDFGDAAD